MSERRMAAAKSKGRVLIVFSGARELELKRGARYGAGTFLGEMAAPLRAIIRAGFEPTFASSDGQPLLIDKNSEVAAFYGGDEARLRADQRIISDFEETRRPNRVADIAREGLDDYAGIFISGGFSALQDLATNKDLGRILLAFHQAGRPTGLICHSPVALLTTLDDPVAFEAAMIANDFNKAHELAVGWPYAGYRLTAFSSAEELLAVSTLGGDPKYFVSDALSQAGAHVDRLQLGAVNVVVDRELITGQQPFSSEAFAAIYADKLKVAASPPALAWHVA